MKKVTENYAGSQRDSLWWETWQKRGFAIAKFVAWLIVAYVLVRLIAIPFGYEFFVDQLSSKFGLEDVYARPFAIALTALTVAATPALLLATLFGYRAKFVFFMILGGSIVVAMSTHFFTKGVYFDRATGKSQKCYAKTLEGFKFSSVCDFDPKLGVRFQKITPEVMKEIVFWEKSGSLKNVPPVKEGQYFDPLTGEAVVWYSLRSDGSIHLFSLPGFDPTIGETLKPITKEIIAKYRLDVSGNAQVVVDDYGSKSISSLIDLGKSATGDIWKWYLAQRNIREVSSESISIDWQINGRSESVTATVEKVIQVNSHVLLTIRVASPYTHHPVGFASKTEVLDKDAHAVRYHIFVENAATPYSIGCYDSCVSFYVNPNETLRALFIINDMKPGQMSSGYVRLGSQYIKYGPPV